MDKVFLFGIGGTGMSKLALLLKDFGYEVYGLDIEENENVKNLRKAGIRIDIGEKLDCIDGAFKFIVYSSAISEENRNFIKAKYIGVKAERRGETLARITKGFTTVVVAGSHGKTTTTSMIGHILSKDLKVNVYVGGETVEFNSFNKDAKFFVIESDESDGTFLYFNPFVLVITNIDRDHLNYYGQDFNNLKNAFLKLVEKSKYKVVSMDDENAYSVVKSEKNNIIYYSLKNEKADMFGFNLRFLESGTKFDLRYKGNTYENIFLPAFGEQNVLNAMASLIASDISGINIKEGIESISTFNLPKRRMQKKWEVNGIMLIDDHADHPTEVEATLSALRKHFGKRRIVAVFQPHRYTRVSMLKEDIVKPFYLADMIVLTDIFPAFEKPIEGVSGEKIYEWLRILNPEKEIVFVKDKRKIPFYLKEKLVYGDLVVLLGPGDIWAVAEEVFEILKESKNEEIS